LESLSGFRVLGRVTIAELEIDAMIGALLDSESAGEQIDLLGPTFGRAFGMRGGLTIRDADGNDSSASLLQLGILFLQPGDLRVPRVSRRMAQACAPVMPPGSSIVNVSSVLGLVGPRFPQASYAASKAGVIGLTRDLAQEWSGRKGIRVNALCPGYFRTEMTADGADALQDLLARHSILGRFGEQRELDSALLFLASPASSYVTGTTLTVDGGFTAL
jgi:NAD(P)-dependent dehydrogenase (short-subunit alcohol dehydrogenase family)